MASEISSSRSSSTGSTSRSEKSSKSDKSDDSSKSDRAESEAKKAADEAKKAADEAKRAADAARSARSAAEARRHAQQAGNAQGRAQAAQQQAQASVDTLKRELTTASGTKRPAVEQSLRQAEKALGEARTATAQATAASTQARAAVLTLDRGQSSFTASSPAANTFQAMSTVAATGVSQTGTGSTPRPIGSVDKDGQVPESQLDGAVISAGGAAYPSGTDVYDTQPVVPSNGKPAAETVIYVNGIQNDGNFQYGSMQNVADTMGANVYGIHNSTAEDFPIHSIIGDLAQCATDLTGVVPNSATTALALQVVRDLEAGRPIHLMAHSQGALVTSNALTAAKEYLLHH
ncbi:MAG TPA: hypothetical protein VD972_36015, partial [Hyalangium sp.]|nr:hypothetical protein [Hyalangium sp.]